MTKQKALDVIIERMTNKNTVVVSQTTKHVFFLIDYQNINDRHPTKQFSGNPVNA